MKMQLVCGFCIYSFTALHYVVLQLYRCGKQLAVQLRQESES